MKLRVVVLPALAVAGVVATVVAVRQMELKSPPVTVDSEPAASPFAQRIAATGLVEPLNGVVWVGAAEAGVVASVAVREGQQVRAGEVLLELDHVRSAAELALAKAREAELKAQPRSVDVVAAAADVDAARAVLIEEAARLQALVDSGGERVHAKVELTLREQARSAAAAHLAKAEAALERVRAGAWPEELAVARAEVQAAEAGVARETVRSPIDGTVLLVDARAGEFAPAGARRVALGVLTPMQIRVDIDEVEFSRFRPEAAATASLRGAPASKLALKFLRVVPLVQPKRTLTGEAAERIDTRVVQVIYELGEGASSVQPGMVVDVFIEAGESKGG